MSVAQVAVSKNKRRFKDKKNKFNLDLSYIGKRLIAMGFPSEKTEALYRNPFPEVLRFFEHYHSNNYYIYNLCAEKDRIYDSEKFHGRVKHFPFYDHNAPPLQLIVDCCLDIHQWLNENDKNVAGVHCKAGKGRTGLISCCYLMMNETCKTSDDALLYYGKSRTKDGKGVTIASQIRYIKYYEKVLKNMGGVIPEALPLILTRIKVTCYPKKELKVKGDPIIVIEIADKIVHVSEPGTVEKYKKGVYKADIKVMGVVEGDVKIMLQLKKRGGGKQKLCHFWFNSGFIENYKLDLPKKDIDVANKDKNCKYFKQDFNIECFFKDPDPEELERTKKENGVIEEEEESVEENNTKTDEKEPNGGKKEKKDGRKSFYDYSDYGKIQKALEFSDEENSEAEGVVITNNQDDDSK